MFHWLHHLFNPHCKDCELSQQNAMEIKNSCASCDTLREQLSLEREEKRLLLRKLLPDEVKELPSSTEDLKPIRTTAPSWNERRRLLEENDRAKAEILRKKNEELEKDLQLVKENNG